MAFARKNTISSGDRDVVCVVQGFWESESKKSLCESLRVCCVCTLCQKALSLPRCHLFRWSQEGPASAEGPPESEEADGGGNRRPNAEDLIRDEEMGIEVKSQSVVTAKQCGIDRRCRFIATVLMMDPLLQTRRRGLTSISCQDGPKSNRNYNRDLAKMEPNKAPSHPSLDPNPNPDGTRGQSVTHGC